MTTPTPRERLAEAVKQAESARSFTMHEDAYGELLSAARALLAAPDDAAELAAVKAILESDCIACGLYPPGADGAPGDTVGAYHVQWTPIYNEDGVEIGEEPQSEFKTAPTAVALCAKLGIEVKP